MSDRNLDLAFAQRDRALEHIGQLREELHKSRGERDEAIAERDEARAKNKALREYALRLADAFNDAEEARPGIIEMTRELADLISANLQTLAEAEDRV